MSLASSVLAVGPAHHRLYSYHVAGVRKIKERRTNRVERRSNDSASLAARARPQAQRSACAARRCVDAASADGVHAGSVSPAATGIRHVHPQRRTVSDGIGGRPFDDRCQEPAATARAQNRERLPGEERLPSMLASVRVQPGTARRPRRP